MRTSTTHLLALAMAALAPSGGCLDTATEACAWGIICPSGKICHSPTRQCVPSAQVDACKDRIDTDPCSFPGSSPDYRCRNGVCVEPYCGDGLVDPNEACDDGAANSDETPDACRTSCVLPFCGDGVTDSGEDCDTEGPSPFCDSNCKRIVNLDVLMVLDNSPSMFMLNTIVGQNAHVLLDELRAILGGLPNLHMGMTTTDLGTWGFQNTSCDRVSGDWGTLLAGECQGLQGKNYIIDVEPEFCTITKEPDGSCSAHECDDSHCGREPDTVLMVDENGCPRCRNFPGQTLEEVGVCLISVESNGCEFTQPLEAMYKALDNHPQNTGFLRENSYLLVVILTDKDDCSASSPVLFDPNLEAELGPLTPFRCFEFGVTCDIDDRDHVGLRQQCRPRDDSTLVYPVARYVDLLDRLRPPEMRMATFFAGPVDNQQVTVGRDASDRPEVEPSCWSVGVFATPGIRLKAFAEAANSEEEMEWAYASICNRDFGPILQGIAERMAADLGL